MPKLYSLEQLIGKPEAYVKKLLRGKKYRIVKVDSQWFAVTMDHCPQRYNLYIEKGKVIDVRMG